MDRQKFLFNRRQFLKTSAGAVAFLGLSRRAYPFYNGPALQKWHSANPLRHFLTTPGLLLAQSDHPSYTKPGAVHYTINVGQFTDQLHPALNPTNLFGYYQPGSKSHLGMTIVANKGKPTQVTFVNKLPNQHIIPVDTSAFFSNASQFVNGIGPHAKPLGLATATHLHGGFIPWVSDGGPYDWFTPTTAGPSFKNNITLVPGGDPVWGGLPPGQAEYYWPNDQSARLMWYHDHAHDITRINAYAGIATAYVLRDGYETLWTNVGLLPALANAAEIPLIFQDKIFINPANFNDPTWPYSVNRSNSDLWYPHTYEPVTVDDSPTMTPPLTGGTARWDREASPFLSGSPNPQSLPDPSAIPEMFGDTMLCNGTAYPFLNVTPRRYRFRILNACNARFLNLQLYEATNAADLINLAPTGELDPNGNPVLKPSNHAGPAMVQIGTEGGFLPAPVVFNSPPLGVGYNTNVPETDPTWGNVNRHDLLLAPAERADVIIDFAGQAGKTFILYSDTPAPFPGGDVRNDLYYGMLDTSVIGGPKPPMAGMSPNTRTLLKIVVGKGVSDPVPFAIWLPLMRVALATRLGELLPPPSFGAKVRSLSLNETFDANGRLIQMMGTDVAQYGTTAAPFFGRFLEDPTTEVVNAGATEIWEIYNLTGDTHPIHFHLVNVQILDRRPFDPAQFPQKVFLGPRRQPDANERGWKETVRMEPGEVTRVIMRFDLPSGLGFAQPSSNRTTLGLPAPPFNQIYHEYVYHCHILEHEEHDMMRTLIVKGPART